MCQAMPAGPRQNPDHVGSRARAAENLDEKDLRKTPSTTSQIMLARLQSQSEEFATTCNFYWEPWE